MAQSSEWEEAVKKLARCVDALANIFFGTVIVCLVGSVALMAVLMTVAVARDVLK